MTVPAYLPYYVLTGTAVIILAVLLGLNRALVQADWSQRERIWAVALTAFVLIIWLSAAIALGAMGTFHAAAQNVPTVQYAIALPIIIGALLIWRSSAVKRMIVAVPQSWIVGVQLYRALGVIFLILYSTGKLPGLFAWLAGVGDILVGVLAPGVAIAYARDPLKNGDLVSAWNWFGIGDLVIASLSKRRQAAAPTKSRDGVAVLAA
jgi:hypothetical protein